MSSLDSAEIAMRRIDALARISDDPACLSRTYGSPAMARANAETESWMKEAGMSVRRDAVGNLIGNYPAAKTDAKILLLGSHLDTVRNAGKFDGPLGVIIAISAIQHFHAAGRKFSFSIEVIGFADEEGARFQTTYLGSKAIAGKLNSADLARTDSNGISLSHAMSEFGGDPENPGSARIDPGRLLGYVEVHIEQGPVLEQNNLPLGVVTAIAGQSRLRVTFRGTAGHAGTVPMNVRRDALCAASEFIVAVESEAQKRANLVATVGQINALPGASNVIPGEVILSLDIRHPQDNVRSHSVSCFQAIAKQIVQRRGISFNWDIVQESNAVSCDSTMIGRLKSITERLQGKSLLLTSGAGHDAVPISTITPVGMLFVRCKGGISHHPDESATVEDIRVAIAALIEFIEHFAG